MPTWFNRRQFSKLTGAAALVASAGARAAFAQPTPTTSNSAMQRADELLRQMTVEEKAMQLSSVFPLALFDAKGADQKEVVSFTASQGK